jgi:phosphoribosyl-ATP pyrophosphohydrolase/phosphoribosyl-AMP cyclohydrolase
MLDINTLKFDEKGLIPAIVVDSVTKKVLTLAYMNRESLEISLKEEKTCFWSRSRQELWRKGETSGNVQHIVSITADCDNDALVVVVDKEGPACHTGTDSCFTKEVFQSESRHEFSLEQLMDMLVGRKVEKKEGSYTTYLFEKGIDNQFIDRGCRIVVGNFGYYGNGIRFSFFLAPCKKRANEHNCEKDR